MLLKLHRTENFVTRLTSINRCLSLISHSIPSRAHPIHKGVEASIPALAILEGTVIPETWISNLYQQDGLSKSNCFPLSCLFSTYLIIQDAIALSLLPGIGQPLHGFTFGPGRVEYAFAQLAQSHSLVPASTFAMVHFGSLPKIAALHCGSLSWLIWITAPPCGSSRSQF